MKKLLPITFAAMLFGSAAFSQSIPNWIKDDSNGEEWRLHDVLEEGNAVLLDFFATWCGPCQQSTPSLEQIWQDYGAGNGNFYIFGMDVDNDETDAQINNFKTQLGATYPAFKQSYFQFGFYDNNFASGAGSIPLFALIIPDVEDPANSTVEYANTGWSGSVENNIRNELIANGFSPVGMEEISEKLAWKVFPNPANQEATIVLNPKSTQRIVVEIFNLLGEQIEVAYEGVCSSQEMIALSTADFESGLYFVRVSAGNQFQTTRLNVTH